MHLNQIEYAPALGKQARDRRIVIHTVVYGQSPHDARIQDVPFSANDHEHTHSFYPVHHWRTGILYLGSTVGVGHPRGFMFG